jgi:hypothetical protein
VTPTSTDPDADGPPRFNKVFVTSSLHAPSFGSAAAACRLSGHRRRRESHRTFVAWLSTPVAAPLRLGKRAASCAWTAPFAGRSAHHRRQDPEHDPDRSRERRQRRA